MPASTSRILRRHGDSLAGSLFARRIRSRALRTAKPYFVYEPPGIDERRDVPIVYLFRGHQREWVNIREDSSRHSATAIEDLDRRIAAGKLPPVIAVLPGLNSANNHVPSLGIDMVGPWPDRHRGLGTGRFWQYLTSELIPAVERRYADQFDGERYAVGFSLGGFTTSLLAMKLPGFFKAVGIYDGLLMWPDNADPRIDGEHANTDKVWCSGGIFDAAFGKPRSVRAMRRWNPTDMLRDADETTLEALRQTAYFIASAPSDGQFGNVDRTRHFVGMLKERRMPLLFDKIVFHEKASHTWHWTDRFLLRFLERAFDARYQTEPSGPDR